MRSSADESTDDPYLGGGQPQPYGALPYTSTTSPPPVPAHDYDYTASGYSAPSAYSSQQQPYDPYGGMRPASPETVMSNGAYSGPPLDQPNAFGGAGVDRQSSVRSVQSVAGQRQLGVVNN